MVLDWMKAISGKPISFDYWARGNYIKHVLYQRQSNQTPIHISVHNAEQLRWAYRRLALLGMPVNFVYCGPLSMPQKVLHLHPWDALLDAGWGFMGALGSKTEINNREYFPIIGTSRLMPESILDCLIDEASSDFVRGRVFVAPADLIGLRKIPDDQKLLPVSDITDGVQIASNIKSSSALMDLELPYVDGMNPIEFQKFLKDHEGELARFQACFRKLFTSSSSSENYLNEIISELRQEVADICHSQKYHKMRQLVSVLEGTFATIVVTLGAVSKAVPSTIASLAGIAAAGVAGKTLFDLWKQIIENKAIIEKQSYAILWRLGVTKPSKVKCLPRTKVGNIFKKLPKEDFKSMSFHWLCPPKPGILIPSVKSRIPLTSGYDAKED